MEPTCPRCGRPLPPPVRASGRPRIYCGDRCRVTAFRARHARIYNDAELLELFEAESPLDFGPG